MVSPLTPDNTRGWLGVLLPLLDKANRVTLLFVLVTATLMVWYLLGQLERARERNHLLGQWLLDAKAAHLALALQCKPPPAGEGR